MNRARCFDVPKHHTNLWQDYAATSSEAVRVGAAGDARAAGFSDAFLPELHHRLYAEAPRETEARGRAASVRARLHDLASELPEFATLRKQTVRDPMWAGMAATALADSVARAMPERTTDTDADKARAMLEGLRSLGSVTGQDLGEHVARAEGGALGAEYATAEEATRIDDSAIRNALRAGIADAERAIADAKQAFSAFGWGTGPGEPPTFSDPGVALALARHVASSDTLKRIVALAGRLTMTARAKRASRTEYARSEVVGVEPTGDVSRLLPTELSALASPVTTAALYSRLLQNGALGYQLRGREREAKGPIVLVLDQSGSMREDGKDVWAKAVALALLDTARSEKRAFGVVLYNGCVQDARLFPKSRDVDPRELLALLSYRPTGGTSYAPAFDRALTWIATAGTFKRADVVHITDGDASVEDAPAARARAKTVGCHVYGIGIGAVGPALAAWSDETAEIRDVSADTAAVDLIFDSI